MAIPAMTGHTPNLYWNAVNTDRLRSDPLYAALPPVNEIDINGIESYRFGNPQEVSNRCRKCRSPKRTKSTGSKFHIFFAALPTAGSVTNLTKDLLSHAT